MQRRQGPGLDSYPCSASQVAPYILGLGLSSSWMCWAVRLCHRLGDLPPATAGKLSSPWRGRSPRSLSVGGHHNHYVFLHKRGISKILCNFVKVKSQMEILYISMAYPFQLVFQDATSTIMEELLHFHDHILITVFFISSLVLYIISLTLTAKLTHTSTIDAQEVESI